MGKAKSTQAFAGKVVTEDARVVLVVEDEPTVREITRQVLENAGYRVLAAGSPSDALRLSNHCGRKIDLLLSDVVMPEMNGIELADRLRRLQPDMVTVFMSGYADGDLVRKETAQLALHIQKPFTANFLLARIAHALAPMSDASQHRQ
jgi:two-component system, cell cycle sensor histidine kinase and response regulator CckA